MIQRVGELGNCTPKNPFTFWGAKIPWDLQPRRKLSGESSESISGAQGKSRHQGTGAEL